jgi:invasion protein IalB
MQRGYLKSLMCGILYGAHFAAIPAYGQEVRAWETQCVSTSLVSPRSCFARQQIRTEANQVLFELSIATQEGREGVRFDLLGPLGFYIPAGVTIFDQDEVIHQFEIKYCNQEGCFSSASFSEDQVQTLKNSSDLKLEFETQNDMVATIPISSAGLADSLAVIMN